MALLGSRYSQAIDCVVAVFCCQAKNLIVLVNKRSCFISALVEFRDHLIKDAGGDEVLRLVLGRDCRERFKFCG